LKAPHDDLFGAPTPDRGAPWQPSPGEGRRIVMLGGSGFLGGPLARRLLELGYDVDVVDDRREFGAELVPRSEGLRNVSENQFFGSPRHWLKDAAALVHLRWRGIARPVPLSEEDEEEHNVVPTRRALAVSRDIPVLFASSAGALYSDAVCAGTGAHEDDPVEAVRAYGRAKLRAEALVLQHGRGRPGPHGSTQRRGPGGLVFRPANPYGPGQAADARCGVVGTFLTRVSQDRSIALYGDGGVERDFVYVDDLADVFVRGLDAAFEGRQRIYNVGGGEATSLASLLEIVERVVGRRARVERLPPRQGDRRRVFVDVSRAQEELGWEPSTGLREGIERTWFALADIRRTSVGPLSRSAPALPALAPASSVSAPRIAVDGTR